MKLFSPILFNMVLIVSPFISCNSKVDKNKENPIQSSHNESKSDLVEIVVGKQIWSKTNLDITTFRNGEFIPEAKTDFEWKSAGENHKPAWCYYDNDKGNNKEYGKLYNWYALNDSRGFAPIGWHVPTESEWNKLVDFLGGDIKAGVKLKSKTGWTENGNGSNLSLFDCLPNGHRSPYYDASLDSLSFPFRGKGNYGIWWSVTESSNKSSWASSLGFNSGFVVKSSIDKSSGLSVRCIKN